MQKNVGPADRGVRIVAGLLLLAAIFYTGGLLQILVAVIGLIALVTGLSGYCVLYSIAGINRVGKNTQ
ncbi:MAG: DUF2892 domain-containing protein [Candidatus Thermoplasmatota archaeon]|jgi:hypothetical protein|nr:DUF2892 domain-containing protein [Candidatus Sysuiplasma jiujiangense]MBX8641120.1 DUF2892 domain-containing protein [Candidatus Sysuiplasma jiujiangense]MCL4317971.1 DUF2892 domain-containing protein [Candidatus Thermoplasmatota archaeon]